MPSRRSGYRRSWWAAGDNRPQVPQCRVNPLTSALGTTCRYGRSARRNREQAINGVQHPLHRQSLRSLPAHTSPALVMGTLVWGFGGVCGDTPLAALPSEGCVGTLLSPLCLRRGVPIILLTAIVFPRRGKRSSPRSFFQGGENDPRSLHADRPFAPGIALKCRQFRDKRTHSGYWIGSPAIYHAGGPPLDFGKTGWPLFAIQLSKSKERTGRAIIGARFARLVVGSRRPPRRHKPAESPPSKLASLVLPPVRVRGWTRHSLIR